MSLLVGAELDRLVEQHVWQVRLIAKRLFKVTPASITRDELVSAGLFALFKAAPHFDPARGCKPQTYFEKRIWGAMRDCIRETAGRKGHPRPRVLGLPCFPHLISPDLTPEEEVNQADTKRTLLAAIARLSARERVVMTLTYFGDCQLAEIAALCGVSIGRISQHRTAALAKLRVMLASSPSAEGRLQRSLAA